MRVTISKVHENLYAGEANSLTVPTTEGQTTILGNHEPFVATLLAGKLVVRDATGERSFDVSDGVLEVSGNQATVLL